MTIPQSGRLAAAFLVGFMILAIGSPGTAVAGLLRNPGFESGGGGAGDSGTPPGEWLYLSGTPDTYSADGSNGRAPGLGIFPAGQLAADGIRWVAAHDNGPEIIGQVLTAPLTPDEQYVLTAKILHTSVFPGGTGPGGYQVYLDNVLVGSLSTTVLTDVWEDRTLTFTAPGNAATLTTLRLIPQRSTSTIAYVAIDALSLDLASSVPVNDARGMALLVALLVGSGVMVLRRRLQAVRSS